MNKGVLISIQPKWCAMIASGHKTIEIRKTKPALAPPFKVYIYCTKPDTTDPNEYLETHSDDGHIHKCNGKVFAEFVCYTVTNLFAESRLWLNEEDVLNSCLTAQEIREYANGSNALYGWHISDLIIYDKPKDLSEFVNPCRHYFEGDDRCGDCPYFEWANNESYHYEECVVEGMKPIKRPPQSWCYAEEVPKRTNTGEPDGDLPLFY